MKRRTFFAALTGLLPLAVAKPSNAIKVSFSPMISSMRPEEAAALTREMIVPELIRMLESNIAGSRVKLKQELGI